MARDSASPIENVRLLVGRYRLGEEIGRGGMGVVYRGVDTMMERPVAVKLLKSSAGADHPTTQRFLHEAKNAARIQHEHVIQVFDVGKNETGEPFFVMELVSGVSLAALLQAEKQIPAARVAHIGTQICEALHAAHRAGIVHRDLK
ncbi:MAG: serine/threonine-protein kinase, partial [Minicystis sp.]